MLDTRQEGTGDLLNLKSWMPIEQILGNSWSGKINTQKTKNWSCIAPDPMKPPVPVWHENS